MKRNLFLSVMLVAGTYAMACTNFIGMHQLHRWEEGLYGWLCVCDL